MISKNRIKMVRSLGMKKFRTTEALFVAEGPKVVGDLLASGRFRAEYLAVLAGSDFEKIAANTAGCTVDIVTDEELRRVSLLEAPQQVLAVFRQPAWAVERMPVDDAIGLARHELCLALDDVQNPGNVGTIVRLADWFGIGHVFCSEGCADVFNPKTVQATMGALAHVEVHVCDLAVLARRVGEVSPVYGTFLDGENIYGKRLEQRGLIVMGNEGRGVSAEVERGITQKLYVPNFPQGRATTESLNVAVATAVVCAEFRRQAL